jgi:hypothetical protein
MSSKYGISKGPTLRVPSLQKIQSSRKKSKWPAQKTLTIGFFPKSEFIGIIEPIDIFGCPIKSIQPKPPSFSFPEIKM